MTERKRSPYWDNMKALLIILVVFGHFMYELEGQSKWIGCLFDFIYMFHMPAFIFVSGYFSRSENSRSGRSIIKLLCAYFLFNTVFIVWGAYKGSTVNYAVPYYSYWYLLALVAWRISVPYVAKMKAALPISIIAALFVGFCGDVSNVLAMQRIVSFYPFFLAGYMLGRDRADKFISAKYIKRFLPGLFALAVGVILAYTGNKLFDYSEEQLMMGLYGGVAWQAPAARLSLFVIAAVMIFGIMLIVPDVKIPVLTKAGKNTLAIFLIHRPLVLLLADPMAKLGSAQILAVSCILTVVLVVALGTDLVSRILNGVLDHGADVIFGCGEKDDHKLKNAACFAIYAAVALALVCTPFLGSIIG